MKTIKIAALKNALSATLRRVEAGEAVLVTDRDRPVAVLTPVLDEDGVTILPARRPFRSVRDVLAPKTRRPTDSLAALREERGSR
ncbi:MAG: hypothetical protein OHK0013_33240 [Sandaracinaceae bacterium]